MAGRAESVRLRQRADPGNSWIFFTELLAHPMAVGALAPSSARLAREAVLPVPGTGEPTVVEIGAGTGVFTRQILLRLGGRGRFLAVERNQRFALALRRAFPTVDVACADAAQLPELMARRGMPPADVVVSTMPWATFPGEVQQQILDAVISRMAPEAVLTTVAYSATRGLDRARRFEARLRDNFDEVIAGRTVWRNFLPALVYYARRPKNQ